jgi:hypothetical protein
MRVHVNKARRHDFSGDVDLTRALLSGDDAHGGHAIAGDGNIRTPARPTPAVDHLTAP